jgi:uncharacterized protein
MKSHIQRTYNLSSLVKPGKVLVVYGPRRAGKTTLVKEYLDSFQGKKLYESGDNSAVQEVLGSQDEKRIVDRVSGLALYVIDEAQSVPNIGLGLKLMVDARPDLIVIATGSSSFDLAHKIGEPLVGRREVITLYPLALQELAAQSHHIDLSESVDEILVYGSYPQVFVSESTFDKESQLQELVEGYLLKDIFTLEQVKAPSKLLHLVKLLAQYIGQPISSSKLASEVGLNHGTVERYIDLLEKTFVIKKVLPFSQKLSQSLKFKPKYYFYDLGVRNALLGNFLPVNQRIDRGHVWENFCFIERMKKHAYERKIHPQSFFFQSYVNKKEIDIIEEYNGYTALECKWSADEAVENAEWSLRYPESPIQVVTRANCKDYLV